MVASSRFARLGRPARVAIAVLGAVVLLPLIIVLAGRVTHRSETGVKTGTGGTVAYATSAAAPTTAAAAPTRAAGSAASGSYPSATTAAGSAALPAPAATSAAPAAANPSTSGRSASSTSDAVGGNVVLAPTGADQKIIRTGEITLTVKDVIGTQAEIWNLAARLGGFVIASNASGAGDDTRGQISFRVPTDNYKIAMETLRSTGKVESEKSTAQDVSEEYVDLVARRDNLELTVRQLQGFLGQAKNVDEALKVQSQLNIVQNDLEKIKGRIGFLDNRAAYSTITATLMPVIVPKAAPPPVIEPERGWSFSRSVSEAWGRSVRGLENIADGLIAVFVGGWWFFLPLIIGAIILARWTRTRRPPLQPAVATVPAAPTPPDATV